jgi:chromosome segregation ATPase
MSFFGFVKNFGKQKAQQTGQSLVQMLAAWDPDTASAAEIEQMEERLDKLTTQVAQARQTWQKEQEEADAIEKLYDQRMKAAELLQGKLEQASGDEAAELEKALNELVDMLESMQPDIEREMEEAVEAEAFMKELEEVAAMSAEKLKTARRTLENAKRDMARAKIQEQRAQERAEQAAELAGLRQETDQLGSALSAMRREADSASARAEAMNLKSRLLAPTREEKTNSLVEEALQQAGGSASKPTNIKDRLAGLKRK